MRLLATVAIICCMVASCTAQCVAQNSTDLVFISTELFDPDYTITFDDLGFPASGWGWVDSSSGPLHIYHGQQNITISGATCRVWNGYSGFYPATWNSAQPWMGEAAPNIGDFAIVGGGGQSGQCLFEFSPPITAFTIRLVATPSPNIAYMPVFGVNGTQIDCAPSLPTVAGTNGYTIVGAYSSNLIESFSLEVGTTGIIQADNIQLLTCGDGYQFNGTACSDIDECSAGSACSLNATCVNTDGSFNCSCNGGFEGDGFTCHDIDECSTGSPCSLNATCTNTDGSFKCSCNDGFQGDGVTGCQPVETPVTQPVQGTPAVEQTPEASNTPRSHRVSSSSRTFGNMLIILSAVTTLSL